jgi:hypothetical protein
MESFVYVPNETLLLAITAKTDYIQPSFIFYLVRELSNLTSNPEYEYSSNLIQNDTA